MKYYILFIIAFVLFAYIYKTKQKIKEHIRPDNVKELHKDDTITFTCKDSGKYIYKSMAKNGGNAVPHADELDSTKTLTKDDEPWFGYGGDADGTYTDGKKEGKITLNGDDASIGSITNKIKITNSNLTLQCACPPNEKYHHLETVGGECKCKPGFYRNMTNKRCQPCHTGTYKTNGGDGACTPLTTCKIKVNGSEYNNYKDTTNGTNIGTPRNSDLGRTSDVECNDCDSANWNAFKLVETTGAEGDKKVCEQCPEGKMRNATWGGICYTCNIHEPGMKKRVAAAAGSSISVTVTGSTDIQFDKKRTCVTHCPQGKEVGDEMTTPACRSCHKNYMKAGTDLTSRCSFCPAGTYTAGTGHSSCANPPAGKYANKYYDERLNNCPAGTYGTAATSPRGPGANAWPYCTKCPVNRVRGETGATRASQCIMCGIGKIPNDNQTECVSCPKNTYKESNEAASCTTCGSWQYTDGEGEQGVTACKNEMCIRDENGKTVKLRPCEPTTGAYSRMNWQQMAITGNDGPTNNADYYPDYKSYFSTPAPAYTNTGNWNKDGLNGGRRWLRSYGATWPPHTWAGWSTFNASSWKFAQTDAEAKWPTGGNGNPLKRYRYNNGPGMLTRLEGHGNAQCFGIVHSGNSYTDTPTDGTRAIELDCGHRKVDGDHFIPWFKYTGSLYTDGKFVMCRANATSGQRGYCGYLNGGGNYTGPL